MDWLGLDTLHFCRLNLGLLRFRTYQVIEDETSQPDAILSKEDIDEVLSEEWPEPSCRPSIFGYPTRPLYRELGNMFQHWFDNK